MKEILVKRNRYERLSHSQIFNRLNILDKSVTTTAKQSRTVVTLWSVWHPSIVKCCSMNSKQLQDSWSAGHVVWTAQWSDSFKSHVVWPHLSHWPWLLHRWPSPMWLEPRGPAGSSRPSEAAERETDHQAQKNEPYNFSRCLWSVSTQRSLLISQNILYSASLVLKLFYIVKIIIQIIMDIVELIYSELRAWNRGREEEARTNQHKCPCYESFISNK